MTEEEWLACTEPRLMLRLGKATERKLRLFACACCRRIWQIMAYDEEREAVEVLERYLDGLLDDFDLRHAYDVLDGSGDTRAGPAYYALHRYDFTECAEAAAFAVFEHSLFVNHEEATAQAAEAAERQQQAILLRHLVGNPFHPCRASDSWPAIVLQLADALYNGEDCGLALHDALVEAGQPDLADHFRQEQTHPKGCWVVDLVLGKS